MVSAVSFFSGSYSFTIIASCLLVRLPRMVMYFVVKRDFNNFRKRDLWFKIRVVTLIVGITISIIDLTLYILDRLQAIEIYYYDKDKFDSNRQMIQPLVLGSVTILLNLCIEVYLCMVLRQYRDNLKIDKIEREHL